MHAPAMFPIVPGRTTYLLEKPRRCAFPKEDSIIAGFSTRSNTFHYCARSFTITHLHHETSGNDPAVKRAFRQVGLMVEPLSGYGNKILDGIS